MQRKCILGCNDLVAEEAIYQYDKFQALDAK